MDPDLSLTAFRQTLLDLLAKGNPSIVIVARRLGIPKRTLQRRLQNTGFSYSQLLAEVRCEMACQLLEHQDAQISEVAAALGYTNPSNFNRAFQRWCGMSPGQYQQQARNKKQGQGKSRKSKR